MATREIELARRGIRYRLHEWGDAGGTPLVLLHGWMDTGATFAALAAALGPGYRCLAPDWRGFGDSGRAPDGVYYFPDYLADLEALLDAVADGPVNLLGHSMGGNIAGLYAGARPERISRLVCVEGFGMPAVAADEAPDRYARWLDSLREPPAARRFADFGTLASHLRERDPHLPTTGADDVARAWGRGAEEGDVVLRGDPAHRRPNPVLYRLEEAMACWRRVAAPVLWAYGGESRYMKRLRAAGDWERRIGCFRDLRTVEVPAAGHAVHQHRPDRLAEAVRAFLESPLPRERGRRLG